MVFKKRLIFAGFFLIFLLGINIVNAAQCFVKVSCAETETAIMKLSGVTNAHGGTISGSNYAYNLCCPGTGIPTGTKVIGLSGVTNAHAESPTSSNYNTNILYSEFSSCRLLSNTLCNTNEVGVLSLSSETNAHLEKYVLSGGNYVKKICCIPFTPIPLLTQEMGNGIIELSEECDDGNTNNNDGCSAIGQIELGWTCTTDNPSVCSLLPSCSTTADCDSNEECFNELCYPIEVECAQYSDYDSCHAVDGCYYDGNSCINLDSATIQSCSDYSNEECNNDPMSLGCALDETGINCVEIGAVNYCRDYTFEEICRNDPFEVADSNLADYNVDCSLSEILCSCSWDDNAGCFPDYSITTGTTTDDDGNSVTWRGVCSFNEDVSGDCDTGNFQTVSLIGTWVWDPNIVGLTENEYEFLPLEDRENYVLDIDSLYYFDPGGLSFECSETQSTTIECPLQINLPFFGFYNFIATLMTIAVIYGILTLRRNKFFNDTNS